MHVDHEAGLAAFGSAVDALLTAVNGWPEQAYWAPSHCRGWSVVDVVVHVHLGLQEAVLGLFDLVEEPADTDAVGYWRSSPPATDPQADGLDAAAFVRRVAAAYRRPSGAVAHLAATSRGVLRAAGRATPGTVAFQGHRLGTGDLLATWAVEVAVHHLDVGRGPAVDPPAPDALALARRTVEELCGAALPASWPDARAVLLGTGRVDGDAAERRALAALPTPPPVLG
ncbi:maleylpyruvate isomerase N-terminal domain-containing protein [Nakamurella endophytica]|uniref:maleylpyruvate isomerase N-terminal domain-containing protein n=1 Tax=Nakamurella endophytica TaxID=1748367 RepID=UPI00166E6ED4|nr:maleylpyruvate isomerase N-terminal domain-containing protein [Nakamurella endophytica]